MSRIRSLSQDCIKLDVISGYKLIFRNLGSTRFWEKTRFLSLLGHVRTTILGVDILVMFEFWKLTLIFCGYNVEAISKIEIQNVGHV